MKLMLVVLALAAAVRAEETDEASSLEHVRALQGEFDRVRAAFGEEMRALKTIGERRALWEKRPTRAALWMPRFWKIAEAHPDTEAGFEALLWIRNHGGSVEDDRRSVALLTKHHMDHPRLGEMCKRYRYGDSAHSENVLRRILEQSPHRATRALAAFALACNLENRDAAARENEIVKLLEQAARDGRDVRGDGRVNPDLPLARLAETRLFGLRHLRPGKTAPEIEGENADGGALRLSDYHGKVVLLDFWGHW